MLGSAWTPAVATGLGLTFLPMAVRLPTDARPARCCLRDSVQACRVVPYGMGGDRGEGLGGELGREFWRDVGREVDLELGRELDRELGCEVLRWRNEKDEANPLDRSGPERCAGPREKD